MEITTKALQEYKGIYHKEHGIHLSDTEAEIQASNLLQLMNIIYRPIQKKHHKELNNE